MKLLFDQHLSPRLVTRLADLYPGSAHVDPLGLGREDDRIVWRYAQ
jgi:predicted nuclease of predicted toxin-antitoxin system